MIENFILIFISILLLFGIFYLLSNQKQMQPQKQLQQPQPQMKIQETSNQINHINLDENKKNGYENEIMYVSDELKMGSYINQFQEIDQSNMNYSNNQIGFNPSPRCSSGALPIANINVNYLLSNPSIK